MNPRLKRTIDGIAELLFAGMASVLAWRTALSAIDAYAANEVTTLVSLPLWIPITLLVPGVTLMIFAAFISQLRVLPPDVENSGEPPMSGITIGLIGLGGLLLMLVVRIHIAVAMFVAGAAIYVVMNPPARSTRCSTRSTTWSMRASPTTIWRSFRSSC